MKLVSNILKSLVIILVLIIPLRVVCIFQTKTDSLKHKLSVTVNDSVKVHILLQLFWENRRTDFDSAMFYAIQSLELSEKINYKTGIAKSLQNMSLIYKYRGKYDTALQCIKKSKEYYEESGDIMEIAKCLADIGDIYYRNKDYPNALKNLEKSRSIYYDNNQKKDLSRIYSKLGNICQSQNQSTKALEYYGRSLEINKELNFELGLSVNYNNIGNVYLNLSQNDKAIENFIKSLEIREQLNDKLGIASILNNLGLSYLDKGDYQKAVNTHKKALKLYQEIGDKYGIARIICNLGYDSYIAGKYKDAIRYANEGLALSENLQDIEIEKEACYILAESYAEINKFEKAFHFQKLHKTYSDSMADDEAIRLISEIESKFEMANKEKEIALLNAENDKQELKLQKEKTQRYIIIYIFIGIVILAIFVLILLLNRYLSRQKVNKQLQQLNETKSKFFANISHEFRTPLTLLLGPLEKLLDQFKKEGHSEIKMMYRNAKRLLFLNNQLMDLAKLESGKLKLKVSEADITEALKGMVFSFESFAVQQKVEFQYFFPGKPVYAFFAQEKLEKIVYNLLSNAFKFTPEKGTITFVVKLLLSEDHKQLVRKMKKTTGDIISISVSDTGKGIPQEYLERIFERFYQIDNKYKRQHEGTGLGLALTKELVELHRGSIVVESQIDKGSTFIIYLPIQKNAYKEYEINEEAGIDNNQLVAADSIIVGNKKEITDQNNKRSSHPDAMQILIVEDNRDMREYIKDCLNKDYDILEAENGNQGFDIATDILPGLILTDLMMPVMDGLELCTKIKTDIRTSHIPVIMLTALSEVEDKVKGLETGADDYMAKPFNRKELLVRIQNLIDQRNKLKERFGREIRIQPKEISVTSADERFLLKMIATVEDHISDPDLNVDQVTSEIGLSRSQLHRKTKALTGQTTTEFIRTIRLKRAACLFEQHYGSVAETVYAVGFNSLSYFTKCFHKQFGLSPKEYVEHISAGK
ncbi:MAG: tetratricopeptide repeat protein [Bacteroidales bacterium]|nr:tetratricopeptide repeat protein [Bacteroidales bacterium]